MLNVVALMGRLVADPELKTTQSGNSVCTFRVAVDRSYVQQGEERQADFITVTAWRKTAEFVSKYFQKGSMISVQGRLETRQYQDKNGNNRKAVEFVVDDIDFCGSKQSNQPEAVDDGGTNPPAAYRNQQPTPPEQMGFTTQSQRQKWQGAADRPGNVQVEPSFSQGSADDFSVLDDSEDLPF